MKKTFLFIIALLSFVVGVLAVDLSPPPKPQKPCLQSGTEKQSVAPVVLESIQDKSIVQNKLIEIQNEKAITVSVQKEILAEFNTNPLTAKSAYKTFDPPPNIGIEVFNGNIANQIRAQPV